MSDNAYMPNIDPATIVYEWLNRRSADTTGADETTTVQALLNELFAAHDAALRAEIAAAIRAAKPTYRWYQGDPQAVYENAATIAEGTP